MPATSSSFPALALDWLTGSRPLRILTLGRSCTPLIGGLAARGHQLTACDPEPDGVRALLTRAPRALPAVALPHALPFVPHAFDLVIVNRTLHTLDLAAALPEWARVLAPGGQVAVAYTIRDDSVPWVRRLAGLIREVDPDAMTGDYGTASVDSLASSTHFDAPQTRSFRLWAPMSRGGMLSMVSNRFPQLDEERRDALLTEVAALYDSSARRPEPLQLPYQVACWRAEVDHSTLAFGLAAPDDALAIALDRHPGRPRPAEV